MPDTTTIYLKDYQPPVFAIDRVDLAFELYDDHVLVENRMQLTRCGPGALHLSGDELELVRLDRDGSSLSSDDYELKGSDLHIYHCPDRFELMIITRIRPQDNTKLMGLYRSHKLFCTQCEAEGFRRITWFLDRPDVLTSFTTRITADKDKYPILLSNGNLTDAGDAGGGRHWVLWEDPFKKPAYLFALVAGDLVCVQDEFITCSGKAVDLRIYVEKDNEDKCAHAMTSLKKCMRWDEEVYGREYDLSIFMIVAVSDFNMGAMENKGLNIFNSKYILARPDTATDQDYADVEGVVAHEYFHNWTGNRVTCRDWFQLSLKEGLTVFRDQEFSRDMNSRDVNRIMDVKVLRATQFPEDAGSMAHPVRPASYQEINNFYTATVYNKGAEVIRMQHTLLGAEGFRRGMDLYFERHDGQAVTIDDFVAAMEDANKVDFTQFKRWYSQAGTPQLSVTADFKDNCLSLTMRQSCAATPECQQKLPFHIPIRLALFDKDGEKLPLDKDILELREAEQTFRFENLTAKPVISLLRDFSAPVQIKQDISQEELLSILRFENDGYAKWDAAQRLALSCIHAFIAKPAEQWTVPADLLEVYQQILQDDSLDESLRANLLLPPGFEEITASMKNIDVAQVDAARDAFRLQLSKSLFQTAEEMYQMLWAHEDGAMNAHAYAQRELRNVCLWLQMKADETATINVCRQQFANSPTMTDQLSAFVLLNSSQNQEARQETVASFYQQWSENELVMDKWFSVQATGEQPGTLTVVKSLLKHPAFSIKNPNKVRSLVGAFCQSNPRHFHAVNGEGYLFLGDMLIALDSINPQIAARLATPFTRWQQFDAIRQTLIQKQLMRLSALSLSSGLNEMVSKSLVQ